MSPKCPQKISGNRDFAKLLQKIIIVCMYILQTNLYVQYADIVSIKIFLPFLFNFFFSYTFGISPTNHSSSQNQKRLLRQRWKSKI